MVDGGPGFLALGHGKTPQLDEALLGQPRAGLGSFRCVLRCVRRNVATTRGCLINCRAITAALSNTTGIDSIGLGFGEDGSKKRAPAQAGALNFILDDYILLQVFVDSSHFMWAFTQPALVVGTLEAAKPGPAKATANPTATITERSFCIWISSPR